MARNCPSYKSMYQESQLTNRDLKRRLRALEEQLAVKERFIDSIPEEDEDITIHAKRGELETPDAFLDLEGKAILIVRL